VVVLLRCYGLSFNFLLPLLLASRKIAPGHRFSNDPRCVRRVPRVPLTRRAKLLMPHRLLNWWNRNNAWHIAAAEAVVKSLGAEWSDRDAHWEDVVVVGRGESHLPPAGDISGR